MANVNIELWNKVIYILRFLKCETTQTIIKWIQKHSKKSLR